MVRRRFVFDSGSRNSENESHEMATLSRTVCPTWTCGSGRARRGPREACLVVGETMTWRNTPQRVALSRLFEEEAVFRSAQQLHERLLEDGETVSLATVYRYVNTLAEQGSLETFSAPGEVTRYRRCRLTDAHHHLVCRNCGVTVERADSSINEWVHATAQRYGFVESVHSFVISGLCCACQPTHPGLPSP